METDLVWVFGTYLREYHGYEGDGDDAHQGEAEFIVDCLKRDGLTVVGPAMTDSAVPLGESAATRVLADEAYEGRWNPLRHTNILPLAQHTIHTLYQAGYRLVPVSVAGCFRVR